MKQIMEEKAQNYKNGKINYVTEKVVKDSTITYLQLKIHLKNLL